MNLNEPRPDCPQCGSPNGAFSEIPPGGAFTDIEPSQGTAHIHWNNEAAGYFPDIRLRHGDNICYRSTWTLVVYLFAVGNNFPAAILLLLTAAFRGKHWGAESVDWAILAVSVVLMAFHIFYGRGYLRKHAVVGKIGVHWYQAVVIAAIVAAEGFLLAYMSAKV